MEAYGELTGFQIINKAGYPAVTTTAWRPNIHNNYFHMTQGTACNIIEATGQGMSHGYITRNRFSTWVSGAITSAISVANGTGCTIADNWINNYSGTMDIGINTGIGAQQIIADNVVSDGGASGTITVGIAVAAGSTVVGNRIQLPTGTGLSGGTADRSFVLNFDAENGGATAIES
jgi:hypothetical protein